ncbi:phasin family protein [Spiribacter halobius]|uniref:Phasin family protein n=1 Tax=Sediminicurvatus halobius TaxID=2182432 RepID=A0A2U2N6F9_9GAMM|nr:phasin family protein [Spiribacter halobius]PWG64688.1 phasin family protein [Spiribacter halobius]UEX79005.1 phasin family protein [Spiribacter halobius]
MSNVNLNTIQEQTEQFVTGPARSYAALALDHLEQVVNAQIEASRAYAEVGLQQVRAALDVRDVQGFQAYAENQQKAAKEIGERVKSDATRFASLNEEFVGKTRKLVEDNVASAGKAASKATAA